MVENWKRIEWTPNYEVSSHGRVRRITNGSWTYPGKILAKRRSQRGYVRYALSTDGERREVQAHRLVAEAFLRPRPDGTEVNHKNGIPDDNRVENLEWVSHQENLKHAVRLGLFHPHGMKGEDHPRAKLNEVEVKEIRHLLREGTQTQEKIAGLYGVTQSNISYIKQKTWRHVGG